MGSADRPPDRNALDYRCWRGVRIDCRAGGIQEADRIEVLAGRRYIDPLREVLAALDASVVAPFQAAGCAGVGEQMGWLRDELDTAFPEQVNGWTYRRDASYNGDVWSDLAL